MPMRRPVVEVKFAKTSRLSRMLPDPGWFDRHPNVPALMLLAFTFAAFALVRFTRNEVHEWIVCSFLASFILALWGILTSLGRLFMPTLESNGEAATALFIYAALAIALILLAMNPTWLGPLNYSPN